MAEVEGVGNPAGTARRTQGWTWPTGPWARWPVGTAIGVPARAVLSGLLLAAALPPWGWWPLAIVGVAMWDRLLAERPWRCRAARSWLVAVAWLAPGMLWMWDLTPPGYVVAVAFFACYFAVAGALVPASAPARWVALPAALAVAEMARASFPFGGVPLATLAIGQADGPLAQAARLGTAYAVAALVGVAGVCLSALWRRRFVPAAVAGGLVVALVVVGSLAPAGQVSETVSFAIVQGGGEQGTGVADTDEALVFERHVEASERLLEGSDESAGRGVDLVIWPENVVALEGLLEGSPQEARLSELARRLDATLVIGVTEKGSDRRMRNAAVVFLPDGTVSERYEKVRRVPFGEYVPLRGLVERLAGTGSGLPATDAVVGTDPAVVSTPVGDLAVAISWEIFFTGRVREGVALGGELVLNPTNGATYWLTLVQGQQVASSQLRAIETGRWVLQAAPTGYSAVVDQGGAVLARSDVSEPWVHRATAELREGDTWATRLGPLGTLVVALLALALGNLWAGPSNTPHP